MKKLLTRIGNFIIGPSVDLEVAKLELSIKLLLDENVKLELDNVALQETLNEKNNLIVDAVNQDNRLVDMLVDAGIEDSDEHGYRGILNMVSELIEQRNQLKERARLLSLRKPLPIKKAKKKKS